MCVGALRLSQAVAGWWLPSLFVEASREVLAQHGVEGDQAFAFVQYYSANNMSLPPATTNEAEKSLRLLWP
jgi:hypothetical protein